MLVRKDDKWNRDLTVPDIRNWRVVDADGKSIGFVESVVVDNSANALEAILTSANERFAAAALEVNDGVVRLVESLERQGSHEEDLGKNYATFQEAFQAHFKAAYPVGESGFEDWREAYTFGRLMALDADFSGREYNRAEEDLRAHWVSSGYHRPYEEVQDAVEFAYNLTHRMGTYRASGLEREREQILGSSERQYQDSQRAAEYTTLGSPGQTDGSER